MKTREIAMCGVCRKFLKFVKINDDELEEHLKGTEVGEYVCKNCGMLPSYTIEFVKVRKG